MPNNRVDNSVYWNIDNDCAIRATKYATYLHNFFVLLSGIWGLITKLFRMSKPYEFKEYNGKGLIAIVSGGAGGIGYEISRRFVSCGVHVTIIDRDVVMGKKTVEELQNHCKNGGKIEYEFCDFASFSSVRKFAEKFKSTRDRLDILMNNAGTSIFPEDSRTEDGYFPTFQINYLSHFLLTTLLLPLMPPTTSRIVNTCSAMHRQGQQKADDLLLGALYGEPYTQSYADSKQAMLLMAIHLRCIAAYSPNIVQVGEIEDFTRNSQVRFKDSRRFKRGPLVVCADPGGVASNIWSVTPNNLFKKIVFLDKGALQTPAQGAELMVKLAFEDHIEIGHYVYWQNFWEPLLPWIFGKMQRFNGFMVYSGCIDQMSRGLPRVLGDADESGKWWAISEILVQGKWNQGTASRIKGILSQPSSLFKQEKSLLTPYAQEAKQPAII